MTRFEENRMIIDSVNKAAELKPSGTYEESEAEE